MASDTLVFRLVGRDGLSRVLDEAGNAAGRMGRRIDRAADDSDRALRHFIRDSSGRLRDLNGRFVTAGAAARQMGATIRTTDGRLRDVRGRFTSAGGAARRLGEDADTTTTRVAVLGDQMGSTGDAARRMGDDVDASSGRLRDANGRFLSAGSAARRMGDDTEDGSRRSRLSLRGMIDMLKGAGAAAMRVGPAMGGVSGALTGVGAAAAVSTLPAMGAMLPMMAGLVLASKTLKMGFAGVGDAVALAGEDTKEYKKALKEMGPEQRAFTKTLVSAKEGFSGVGKEIQKVMLPGFTRALKAARPLTDSLGKGMVELGSAFGDTADEFGRLMKDSGFQNQFGDIIKMGTGFVRELTGAMVPFTQSLVHFGSVSKPTLDAFTEGISGILSKGLPGFFKGLEGGVKGSAEMFRGLFGALRQVLPALGELVGAIADAAGPALREIFESAGNLGSGAFRALAGAIRFLKPLFGELGGAVRIVSVTLGVIGRIAKSVGKAVIESLWPSFRDAENAVGPLQRLASWLKENETRVSEFVRQASSAIIDLVAIGVSQLPNLVTAFNFLATGVLTVLDGIVSGAAKAFGWVPGLGPKLKKANEGFDSFKDSVLNGLDQAERKSRDWADTVVPRLERNKLKMNIDNWNSQIAVAKEKLSDKNLPKGKRAKLTADIKDWARKVVDAGLKLQKTPAKKKAWLTGNIKDWKSKISQAEKQLKTAKGSKKAKLTGDITHWRSKVSAAQRQLITMKSSKTAKLKGDKRHFDGKLSSVRRSRMPTKTARIRGDAGSFWGTVRRISGRVVGRAVVNLVANAGRLRSLLGLARGGLVRGYAGGGPVQGFPGGGPVRGPGTSTSDSILARVSRDEYVVRARAVAHYGVRMFDALNQMRLPKMLPKAGRRPMSLAPAPAAGGGGAAAARAGGPMVININVTGALDPVAVAQQIETVMRKLQRTYGSNFALAFGR